jgi:hypothetical protein
LTLRLTQALTDGFSTALLAGAGFAALGLVATLVLIRSSDSRAHVDLAAGPGELAGAAQGDKP